MLLVDDCGEFIKRSGQRGQIPDKHPPAWIILFGEIDRQHPFFPRALGNEEGPANNNSPHNCLIPHQTSGGQDGPGILQAQLFRSTPPVVAQNSGTVTKTFGKKLSSEGFHLSQNGAETTRNYQTRRSRGTKSMPKRYQHETQTGLARIPAKRRFARRSMHSFA